MFEKRMGRGGSDRKRAVNREVEKRRIVAERCQEKWERVSGR